MAPALMSRRWVYVADVKGMWRRLRRMSNWLLIAFFFVTPWLSWHGEPLVRLDVTQRRFHLFGSIFLARDAWLLALLGLLLAVSLFFFTSLAGRLWCGFACPQTVFLEEWFRAVERLVEGRSPKRKLRDEGSWSLERLGKKTLKQGIFLLMSVLLGFGFLSWFVGPVDLLWMTARGTVAPGALLVWGGVSGIFYWDMAFFREQFCNFLCPYARFQGVLMDADSLVIGYDPKRGEPRGKAARKKLEVLGQPFGDCVDCGRCVQVCPQGIDIRDGLQVECVSCARCIDACDAVMDTVGTPRGLVRFSSQATLERGEKSRLIRPRVLLYGGILGLLLVGLGAAVGLRPGVDLILSRQPGPLSVREGGVIRNAFTLRVSNRDDVTHPFEVSVEGLPLGSVVVPLHPVQVAPGEVMTVPAFVEQPLTVAGQGPTSFRIRVSAQDGSGLAAARPGTFVAR